VRAANSIQRSLISVVYCVVTALVSGPGSAHTVEITPVGQWVPPSCGPVYAMGISGTYAYLATGLGLQVVDLGNPTVPVVVGRTNIYAWLSAVQVQGTYAYVVFGSYGLQVFDISEPTSPRRVGGTNTSNSAHGVALSLNYAYLAADSGLQVLDISSPANPLLVGRTNVGGGPLSVAISGNYAYLGIGLNLQVIDVSNPAHPVPVAAISVNGSPQSVAVSGNYAYVSAGASLQVIDITNPANPLRTGGVTTLNYVNSIALSGAYAYLATDSGMEVIDVSDPANPIRIAKAGHVGADTIGVSGSHAVLGAFGIQVFDISSPANPVTVGRLPASVSILGVAQSGKYSYLADQYGGLQVIDVSNPASPFRVGGYYDLNKGSYPFDIVVRGTWAWVLDYSNGLQVFSITSPASPALIASSAITNTPERIMLSGNYAYVSHDDGYNVGLSIVDVSNPTSPTVQADYPVPIQSRGQVNWAYAGGVAVSDGHAYLAWHGQQDDPEFGPRSLGWLEGINVTNPQTPVHEGTYYGYHALGRSYETSDVVLSGDFACVLYYFMYMPRAPWYGGPFGGLEIFDISNPVSPVAKGRFETGQRLSSLTLSGNNAYVLGGSPNLRVVDISNPTNLVLVATSDTPGQRIAASGNYAYVAAGAQGLQILCLDCPRLSASLVGGQLQLTWPASTTNYVLESAANLPAAQWLPVSGTPQIQGSSYILTVPATASAAFFRLRGQ
jgi:hypothetical protein